MRRRLLCAVAVVVVGAACHTASVSGSGHIVTRQIQVTSFSKLEVSGSFNVTVSIGSSEAVSVHIDDNLVDSLDVGVSSDELRIGLKSGTSVKDATLDADVTVRSLESLEASGASKITLSAELAADAMTVTLSGATRLSGSIAIDSGSINLSGESGAELSGSATTLEVTASGASNLDATEVTIHQLTIDLSGTSVADVTVTKSLSARASDASTLRYAGSPAISQVDTSGSATIETVTETSTSG